MDRHQLWHSLAIVHHYCRHYLFNWLVATISHLSIYQFGFSLLSLLSFSIIIIAQHILPLLVELEIYCPIWHSMLSFTSYFEKKKLFQFYKWAKLICLLVCLSISPVMKYINCAVLISIHPGVRSRPSWNRTQAKHSMMKLGGVL